MTTQIDERQTTAPHSPAYTNGHPTDAALSIEQRALREALGGLPLNGRAAAAVLAAGIGAAVLATVIIAAAAYPALGRVLTFSAAVGPLSGKTTIATAGWLLSWVILHQLWRHTHVRFGTVIAATVVLVAVGVAGTFPPAYEQIAKLLSH